jgi:hypothetical protein
MEKKREERERTNIFTNDDSRPFSHRQLLLRLNELLLFEEAFFSNWQHTSSHRNQPSGRIQKDNKISHPFSKWTYTLLISFWLMKRKKRRNIFRNYSKLDPISRVCSFFLPREKCQNVAQQVVPKRWRDIDRQRERSMSSTCCIHLSTMNIFIPFILNDVEWLTD